MINTKLIAITIPALFLIGCSVTGNIMPAKDTPSAFEGAVYGGKTVEYAKPTPGGVEYRVFNQGATSYVSVEANRLDAQTRATQFCRESGRQFRLLKLTTSTPPHILGNYPRAEIVFECTGGNPPSRIPQRCNRTHKASKQIQSSHYPQNTITKPVRKPETISATRPT